MNKAAVTVSGNDDPRPTDQDGEATNDKTSLNEAAVVVEGHGNGDNAVVTDKEEESNIGNQMKNRQGEKKGEGEKAGEGENQGDSGALPDVNNSGETDVMRIVKSALTLDVPNGPPKVNEPGYHR